MNFSETVPKAPMRRSRTSLAGSDHDISVAVADCGSRPLWAVNGSGAGVPTPPLRRSRMSLSVDADVEERSATAAAADAVNGNMSARSAGSTPPRPPPPRTTTTSSAVAGYATVDKSSQSSATLLLPPQSPMRHRRKKSYDVIKSQEFGAFFTIPRSYSYSDRNARPSTTAADTSNTANKLPPPSRPARAYNTLGPSRPLRRRLPVSEHEYGDVSEDGSGRQHDDVGNDRTDGTAKAAAAALCSGDVIEKMKLRPLPSPPPPPRKSRAADDTAGTPEPQRRRNTDSALVPFLDRRETSATSSNNDFFADVSRALLASAAKNSVAVSCADDVSVAVQTDPSPAANGYASDDHRDDGSCCSADSYDRPSRSTAATVGAATSRHLTPKTLTATAAATDRPRTRSSSQVTEYVDRPTSGMSVNAADDCSCNGYAMVSDATATGGVTAVRAQRITVEELQVGRMIVADILGQRMAVDDMSGSSVKIGQFAAAAQHPSLQRDAAAAVQAAPADAADDPMTAHVPQLQDDTASVQSSRVSSMYPEVDSDEDRASVLAAPTPPRRRSKPPSSPRSTATADHHGQGKNGRPSGTAVDLSTAADASITELSYQLFRLCHSNVCSLFTKVVQQVVPDDTEKRRDLQAALCFLSIILAGLLILGFGNEKTIHHHHWDFQFPPNQ